MLVALSALKAGEVTTGGRTTTCTRRVYVLLLHEI